MTNNRAAVLERQRPQTLLDDSERRNSQPAPLGPQNAALRRAEEQPTVPRRHIDADEKLMLWGLLFFFGLGLYAAVFVSIGVWLTP